MRKSGLEPRAPLVDLSTVDAPADVAEHLNISAGDPVVRRTRHMFASTEFLGLTEAQYVLEVARIAYAENDAPLETVINVFPSQQWRLSYEWPAG